MIIVLNAWTYLREIKLNKYNVGKSKYIPSFYVFSNRYWQN